MKEQTVYASDDGQRFDTAEDCQLWEKVFPQMSAIHQQLAYGGEAPGYPVPPNHLESVVDDLSDLLGRDDAQELLNTAKRLKDLVEWIWR